MAGCMLCPRRCGADRAAGARGACGADASIRVARAMLHRWEEPCISLGAGSGAVFFAGCPLGCVFCQNEAISRGRAGAAIDEGRLFDIFFELKQQGAENINLVTPTHYADVLSRVLRRAKRAGLGLPIVYNCGGYESVEALRLLEGLIDVYLPDFKYWSTTLAARYSRAGDYPAVARRALSEMTRQRPVAAFDGEKLVSGVLVRHLVLPGCAEDSKAILRYLYETYGDDIWISIMRQYTPSEKLSGFDELGRRVTDEEYEDVLRFAAQLGITCGYTQLDESAKDSFIPQFDLAGVLAAREDKNDEH